MFELVVHYKQSFTLAAIRRSLTSRQQVTDEIITALNLDWRCTMSLSVAAAKLASMKRAQIKPFNSPS